MRVQDILENVLHFQQPDIFVGCRSSRYGESVVGRRRRKDTRLNFEKVLEKFGSGSRNRSPQRAEIFDITDLAFPKHAAR